MVPPVDFYQRSRSRSIKRQERRSSRSRKSSSEEKESDREANDDVVVIKGKHKQTLEWRYKVEGRAKHKRKDSDSLHREELIPRQHKEYIDPIKSREERKNNEMKEGTYKEYHKPRLISLKNRNNDIRGKEQEVEIVKGVNNTKKIEKALNILRKEGDRKVIDSKLLKHNAALLLKRDNSISKGTKDNFS